MLFEVAFAGARLTTGGNVATEGKKLDFNVRQPGPRGVCCLCGVSACAVGGRRVRGHVARCQQRGYCTARQLVGLFGSRVQRRPGLGS